MPLTASDWKNRLNMVIIQHDALHRKKAPEVRLQSCKLHSSARLKQHLQSMWAVTKAV